MPQFIYMSPTKTSIIAHLAAGEVFGTLGGVDEPAHSAYIKVDGGNPNYALLYSQDPTMAAVEDPAGGMPIDPTNPPSGPGVPICATTPYLSGNPVVGQGLFSTMGNWQNTPTSYAYAWQRDGATIAGATQSSYTLVTADTGHQITCTVIATNAAGTATAPPSNAIGPIQPASGARRGKEEEEDEPTPSKRRK